MGTVVYTMISFIHKSDTMRQIWNRFDLGSWYSRAQDLGALMGTHQDRASRVATWNKVTLFIRKLFVGFVWEYSEMLQDLLVSEKYPRQHFYMTFYTFFCIVIDLWRQCTKCLFSFCRSSTHESVYNTWAKTCVSELLLTCRVLHAR
jgi:hypothetical protein